MKIVTKLRVSEQLECHTAIEPSKRQCTAILIINEETDVDNKDD